MRRLLCFAAAAALLAAGLAGARGVAAQQDSMHATHADHAAAAHGSAGSAAPAPAPATGKASTAPAAGAAPSVATAAPSVRAVALRQLAAAEKKLLSLADATPAEKFGWRPAEGVRSVGEVYMHVASANYFLPTFWGAKVPAGVDPRGLEKDGADKAKTVAALKQSFDFLHQAIDAVPEADLSRQVAVFGQQATVGEVMVGLATHGHEHLGQSIAYARMNGIVPPWSAADGARGR
jgi:uncharacterized damage-inducible protein DinB